MVIYQLIIIQDTGKGMSNSMAKYLVTGKSKDEVENLPKYKHGEVISCTKSIVGETGTLEEGVKTFGIGAFLVCSMGMTSCEKANKDNMYKYVSHFGKLNFIELMIPTIANQNGMVIVTPPELHTVQYRTEWNKDDIDKSKIYHPFKNMNDHLYMRNLK